MPDVPGRPEALQVPSLLRNEAKLSLSWAPLANAQAYEVDMVCDEAFQSAEKVLLGTDGLTKTKLGQKLMM